MTKHLAHEVLKAVLVGVGAGQSRCDLGAIDRLRHHAKSVAEHGEIEPREVKNLQHGGIGEEPLQFGASVACGGICTTSAEPSPGDS